jgi:hypothetical protein
MTTIPERSVENRIELTYQPADFYYYNSNLTPSTVDCKEFLLFTDTQCDETDPSWNDISFNCYRKELCNNRQLSNAVLESQTAHLETYTRQTDSTTLYEHSKLNTLNLMAGILAMFIVMGRTS